MNSRCGFFFAWLLLMAMHVVAYADDHLIVERAFYEDISAHQTFDEIKTKPFTNFENALNKGYSSSAFWVRIKLNQTLLRAQEKIAIEIEPAFLDEIALYLDNSSTPEKIVGDRYPTQNNDVVSLRFNFVITPDPAHPYLWLKLQTASTSVINVEAFKLEELSNVQASEYLLSGLLLGVLSIVATLGLVYFFFNKEVLIGAFLMNQVAAIMAAFAISGYQRLLLSDVLSPDAMNHITSAAAILYVLTSLYYYQCFFAEYKPKKWVRHYFWVATALTLVAISLFAQGMVREALSLNMKVYAVSCIAFFFIPLLGLGWVQLKNPVFSKRLFLLTQAHSLIIVFYTGLPALGILAGGKYSSYAGILHPTVNSLIMVLMVGYRAIKLDKERVMEIVEKTKKIEQEKAQKEIQAQFMSMLTHELRTPLSVLRLALPNKTTVELTGRTKDLADQAIDDMLALIGHCTQLDKLDQGLQPIAIQNVRVDAFLENVRERFASRLNLCFVGNSQLTVSCDPTLLQIIFNNLLDNAIKYGTSAGDITVYVEAVSEQAVRIGVQNQISPHVQLDGEDLFKKFYRDASAQQVSGTGLGLYIVRAMCELMHGQAYADVSVAQRITVWVELPVA